MSKYDKFLEEIKHNHEINAKESLERLYQLLKQEDPNMSNEDCYDRLVKDCLVIWSKATIQNNMPEELKDKERQDSGKKGRKEQLIHVTNNGSVAHDSWANHAQKMSEIPETKKIVEELESLRRERDELRQVITMDMKKNPAETFKNAGTLSVMQPARMSEAQDQNELRDLLEVEFPAESLAQFFKDARQVKKAMYLTIKDGIVVSWQSDYQ